MNLKKTLLSVLRDVSGVNDIATVKRVNDIATLLIGRV